MPNDFCIILACHNQEPLLLAHHDILSFLHLRHDVLTVYSGNQNLPVPFVRSPVADNPWKGAILAFVTGLQEARDFGYRYVCYRNGDDWLFHHHLVAERLQLVKEHKLCGYNWLGHGSDDELALNEIYLDMSILCQTDLAGWIKRLQAASPDPEHQAVQVLGKREWYRLEGREVDGGIGRKHEHDHGLQDQDNNRWYCKRWGLIGAHEDKQRREMYARLRPYIHYADELEQRQWFKEWYE